MKLDPQPRFPADRGQFERKLTELFRDAAQQVNAAADGQMVASNNARTSIPTTGTFAKGDFVRKSAPSVASSGIVVGWLRITDGSAHVLNTDWVELVVPTVNFLPLAGGTITGNLNVNGSTNLGDGDSDALKISGNTGIAVTAGTWASSAKAFEFSFPTFGQDSSGAAFISFNAREESAGTWKYKSTDQASLITMAIDGSVTIALASSGSAGSTITFATRTTIDPSGNLIQHVNSSAPTLGTNGQMTFELTSNTELKIKVRGSDGTTRSVSLTLA